MTGGAALPRFMDASEAMTIVTVRDCMSERFYPFVTSSSGYDTGIVVSNTSDEAGGHDGIERDTLSTGTSAGARVGPPAE